MKPIRFVFALMALFFAASVVAQQQSLEVIPLNYRTADQVLPELKPFVESGGAISGMGNQLFLRATPANRQQIKELLAQIDRRPRRLLISVRQDGDRSAITQGTEVSGSVGSNGVRITQPPSRMLSNAAGTVQIRSGNNIVLGQVTDTRSNTSGRSTQQIQVVEGGKAFINVGTSVPVPLRQVMMNPTGVVISDTVVYRDIGTGFYAAPRLAGDSVTLEISPTNDTPADLGAGSANVQRISTTVSARLGEWMEIGGSNSAQTGDESGGLRSSTRNVTDSRRVQLKVEELP